MTRNMNLATDTRANSLHNVASLLASVAAQTPDKPALIFRQAGRDESISFGRLWAAAGAFGNGLLSAGFRPRERAIIMIPMSIDLYVALLAVIKIGGVAVFVDPWISTQRIARFAAFAEPTAFIGIGKSQLLRLFHQRLRRIKISVTNGRKFAGIPARFTLQQLCRLTPDPTVAAVQPSDSALITFTSGSSGEPKGANRTHQFLMAQHQALSTEFPYQESDVDLPMFPVFALNNLVTGLTSVIPDMDFRSVDRIDGRAIAEQIVRHGVTTVTASPPLIDRVAPFVQQLGESFVLRRILTGGAPVTDSQLAHWQQHFPKTELIVAYGSTEAEPVGHIDATQRLALAGLGKGYCTGRPSRLIQTKIVEITRPPMDLSSRRLEDCYLPIGEIGELLVSGLHVCRDYFQNAAATAENKLFDAAGQLWHRMGDTGYFDQFGRFWLVGRVHSTIRRRGVWVHPQLIEQMVGDSIVELDQVAAVGMPDAEMGECVVVVAVIEASIAKKLDPQTLKSTIDSLLRKAGLPCDRVEVTHNKLPVDPRHRSKIDYAEVRKLIS